MHCIQLKLNLCNSARIFLVLTVFLPSKKAYFPMVILLDDIK